MGALSTAVGDERRSRVSGYKINKGNFNLASENLPQNIVILGEANTANQAALDVSKKEVTSAFEAGELYGFGSPIHQIMRILRPISGQGIGGIPTFVIPQLSDVGASATVVTWDLTGVATKNATHKVVIAGREDLDFKSYSYTVSIGDTAAEVLAKIADAVNAVLNSPVSAAVVGAQIVFTTKWEGLTSASIDISFNIDGEAAGFVYALDSKVDGAGDIDLSAAFALFGSDWHTTVINPYDSKLDVLEAFNGVPAPIASGRYNPIDFKPFLSFFGSVLDDKDDLAAITDAAARQEEVTNVLCPAPLSKAFPWEAAANMVALFCRVMQDTPEIDVNGLSYPDMPVPSDGIIGDMSVYDNRDFLIKKGCSTVIYDKGSYKVQDLVNTYHVEDEVPLQFNYCRNLNLDWNIADSYMILEKLKLKDKVLIGDLQSTDSKNAVKPKEWKAVLFGLFEELAVKALINEPKFSKDSLQVGISETNPNRFETTFAYKRTGIARIESTTVEAGY